MVLFGDLVKMIARRPLIDPPRMLGHRRLHRRVPPLLLFLSSNGYQLRGPAEHQALCLPATDHLHLSAVRDLQLLPDPIQMYLQMR